MESRISELYKPGKATKLLLFSGYFFIFFGAIAGFFIGRHLYYDHRTLPNGQMVFSYLDTDRRHGKRMMVISVIAFILSIAFWAIV